MAVIFSSEQRVSLGDAGLGDKTPSVWEKPFVASSDVNPFYMFSFCALKTLPDHLLRV